MKLLSKESIKEILLGFKSGLQNYPLTLVASAVTAVLVFISTNSSRLNNPTLVAQLAPYLIFAWFMIPWTFCVHLWRQKGEGRNNAFLPVFALVAGAIVYVAYGQNHSTATTSTYEITIAFFAVHFLAAALFFSKQPSNDQAFWHANISLFIRFIFSQFVVGVFYVGIAGLNLLFSSLIFDTGLDANFHLGLAAFSFIFLHSWVFVSGSQLSHLLRQGDPTQDGEKNFKYLRYLLQYALIPLVSLYILVLWLYLLKITVQWSLPRGQLTYFILILAGVGQFIFVLGRRFTEGSGSAIFAFYRKYFYWAFAPLLILLWIASYRRLSQYGLTPDRYLVLVLNVWVTCITITFIARPRTTLAVIPLSLLGLCLLLILTPLGVDRLPVYLLSAKIKRELPDAADKTKIEVRKNLRTGLEEILKFKGLAWMQKHWDRPMVAARADDRYQRQRAELAAVETAFDLNDSSEKSFRPTRFCSGSNSIDLAGVHISHLYTEKYISVPDDNKHKYQTSLKLLVQGDQTVIELPKELGLANFSVSQAKLAELVDDCTKSRSTIKVGAFLEFTNGAGVKARWYPNSLTVETIPSADGKTERHTLQSSNGDFIILAR